MVPETLKLSDQLFNPVPDEIMTPWKKMKVAVLFSGDAGSFRGVLEDSQISEKPYEIVVGVTDDKRARGRKYFEDKGIEVRGHSPKDSFSSLSGLMKYYEKLLGIFKDYGTDLIAVSGFSGPILHPIIESGENNGEYTNMVLSVHHSHDLRHNSKNPVYDVIKAGKKETRSSIYIVKEDLHESPIVVQSKPFEIDRENTTRSGMMNDNRGENIILEYADEILSDMKEHGDGPAYRRALHKIADGTIFLHEGKVYLGNSVELPYGGIQL